MAQPIRTATGQGYGAAKAQADAQRAIPLADAHSYEAPVVPLGAPSMRAGEHVMSGVDAGPGPSAAQAGVPVHDGGDPDAVLAVLRGIYQATQNTDLFDVMRAIEMQASPHNYGLADLRNAHGNWGMLGAEDDGQSSGFVWAGSADSLDHHFPATPPPGTAGTGRADLPADPHRVDIDSPDGLALQNSGMADGVANITSRWGYQVKGDSTAHFANSEPGQPLSMKDAQDAPQPKLRQKGPR